MMATTLYSEASRRLAVGFGVNPDVEAPDYENRDDLLLAFLCESEQLAGAWTMLSARDYGKFLVREVSRVCKSQAVADSFVAQVSGADFAAVAVAIRQAMDLDGGGLHA